ncbi:Elongator subunit ELP6 Ecym_5652 [Eremothecium cymbalariae DBVPG|uniref:Elongator complex protein 6 n=1 Tax=Eremothecium cymbalariae (strain CBS 270.75 / DBVPG 7215 / KCTC 17166 / NRRL Y-17582) TaxID=931890 RepID=I6NE95_ERECY|nr:hypothetical protein Ecym_5652 [Eremothecium cymbalariae DBVPG\
MSSQKQDLIVFSDDRVISPQLFKNDAHHMILLTHRIGTSPSWLINVLVESIIHGIPLSLNNALNSHLLQDSLSASDQLCSSPLIIASFIHDSNFFSYSFNRSKLPLNSYKVLDFCTDFVLENLGKPLQSVLDSLLAKVPQKMGSVIILEQAELLMSLFRISSDELHAKFISPLMKKCSLLILVTSVEGFDNDNDEYYNNDAIEFTRFPIAAFHKSIAVFNLKPLDTGRARDVTGIFRITRGGNSQIDEVHVIENEYLFHVQKETTKLFYR